MAVGNPGYIAVPVINGECNVVLSRGMALSGTFVDLYQSI